MSTHCISCDQGAVVKCGSCGKVLYCSEEHKKADAPSHKSNCRPYVVESNSKYGRYLVTSRDVKQGEIIIREAPVTVGPRVDSLPTCLECFTLLYPPVSRCSRCKFTPLCAKCTHESLECDFFTSLSQEQRMRCLTAGSPLVLPLKVLLHSRQQGGDSEQFQRILDMESHVEARRGTGVWRFHQDNVVEPLQVCGVISESRTDVELVQRICGILDVNSFEVRGAGGMGLRLRGVYVDAALMAHDCLTNVHLSVDDNFVMTIRACVDIPAGNPVLYNYTDPLQPSSDRQKHLWEGKYFHCECSRCSDPTELDTYLSAILCPRCRSGRVLPSTDADHWQCDSCKHTLCDGLMSTTVTAAKDLLESVDRRDPDQLEQALHQLSRSFASSHSLLLDLRQSIVAALRDLEPTEQRVRRKVELCRKILPTIRKIEPGISRLIGITLYELHIGLVTLAQDFGETEVLKEAEEVLKEAVSLLLYEPTISPEGDLARQAMAELKTLKHIIAKQELKNTKKSKAKK